MNKKKFISTAIIFTVILAMLAIQIPVFAETDEPIYMDYKDYVNSLTYNHYNQWVSPASPENNQSYDNANQVWYYEAYNTTTNDWELLSTRKKLWDDDVHFAGDVNTYSIAGSAADAESGAPFLRVGKTGFCTNPQDYTNYSRLAMSIKAPFSGNVTLTFADTAAVSNNNNSPAILRFFTNDDINTTNKYIFAVANSAFDLSTMNGSTLTVAKGDYIRFSADTNIGAIRKNIKPIITYTDVDAKELLTYVLSIISQKYPQDLYTEASYAGLESAINSANGSTYALAQQSVNAITAAAALLEREATDGTTYYFSSNASDGGNGLTAATACNSLAVANATTFQPGDRIMFEAGSSFTGQFYPKGSGSEGAPIIVGAYKVSAEGVVTEYTTLELDNSEKPLFDGQGMYNISPSYGDNGPFGTNSAPIYLYNQEYWELYNLAATNWSETDENRERSGIRIEAANGGTYDHLYVINCYIYKVRGYTGQDSIWDEGAFYGARSTHRTGGINLISYTNRGSGAVVTDAVPTIFNDVLIENNYIDNCDANGITTTNVKGELDNKAYRHTNVKIYNNYIHNVQRAGIIPIYTSGVHVKGNYIDTFQQTTAGYGCGIWNDRGDGMLYEYNTVCNGQNTYDGMAFNFDDMTENGIIQYNYTHNNVGGGVMLHVRTGSYNRNNTVRYNVSVNDTTAGYNAHQAIIVAVGESGNTVIENAKVYNNTFINTNDVYPVYMGNEVAYTNNIFYLTNANTANRTNAFSTVGANTTFTNNLFAGVHAADEPTGNGNISVGSAGFIDQNFTGNETQAEIMEKIKLAANSSAIGAGAVVNYATVAKETEDFFGNPVSATEAPNIGAYNGEGIDVGVTYEVTLTANGQGITSGSGVYQEGAEVTASATPTAGNIFAGWYNGTQRVATDKNYVFTITDNVALTAKFVTDPIAKTTTVVEAENAQLSIPTGTNIATSFINESGAESFYNGGKLIKTTAEGATVSLTFTGVSFKFITKRGPGAGKLEITIDGVSYGDIDLYAASATFKQTVFETELPNGEHTVVITTKDAASKNPSSSGNSYNFDCFEYTSLNSSLLGDANGDGVINIKDATAIQKVVAEITTSDFIAAGNADVNKDGNIDSNDVTQIAKYLVRLISQF